MYGKVMSKIPVSLSCAKCSDFFFCTCLLGVLVTKMAQVLLCIGSLFLLCFWNCPLTHGRCLLKPKVVFRDHSLAKSLDNTLRRQTESIITLTASNHKFTRASPLMRRAFILSGSQNRVI